MEYIYTDGEGEFLVRLARNVIEAIVTTGKKLKVPPDTPEKLKKSSGVFVTLEKVTRAGRELRGCIGRPYPDDPLVHATIEAAINSALDDPRFAPVKPDELKNIVVEVSIMTPPTQIHVKSVKDYPKEVKVGRDGLIVECGWQKGLLLPQVAVEQKWDSTNFLSYCCTKAGVTPDMWMDKNTKIYKFQAEIFHEITPKGAIERMKED
jgi:uncharacterized protein (TIGR00296 family)